MQIKAMTNQPKYLSTNASYFPIQSNRSTHTHPAAFLTAVSRHLKHISISYFLYLFILLFVPPLSSFICFICTRRFLPVPPPSPRQLSLYKWLNSHTGSSPLSNASNPGRNPLGCRLICERGRQAFVFRFYFLFF